jgi:hypothetical protein
MPRPVTLTNVGPCDLADLPQWELVQCINTQYMGIARSWQLDGILEAVRIQLPRETETSTSAGQSLAAYQANLRARCPSALTLAEHADGLHDEDR